MSMGPKFAAAARRPRLAFLIILAVALGGCGEAPVQTQAARKPAVPSTDNPDLLLAGALKAWVAEKDAARALRLAAQAASGAPRRADVAWLHLRLCDEAPECDAAPLETRLRKLAPENGVVWLSVLKRAQAARDGRTEAQVLAAMSQAQHFNVYWNSLLQRLSSAAAPPVSQQESAPLTRTLGEISRQLSTLMLPAFAPVAVSCGTEPMRDPARRSVCERIGRALEYSDSYSAEFAGLGIAQRLAAPGSAAAAAVAERIATAAYQSQTADAVAVAQVEHEKFSQELLELMKQLPREQDVSLAILRWAGEPLTP